MNPQTEWALKLYENMMESVELRWERSMVLSPEITFAGRLLFNFGSVKPVFSTLPINHGLPPSSEHLKCLIQVCLFRVFPGHLSLCFWKDLAVFLIGPSRKVVLVRNCYCYQGVPPKNRGRYLAESRAFPESPSLMPSIWPECGCRSIH